MREEGGGQASQMLMPAWCGLQSKDVTLLSGSGDTVWRTGRETILWVDSKSNLHMKYSGSVLYSGIWSSIRSNVSLEQG